MHMGSQVLTTFADREHDMIGGTNKSKQSMSSKERIMAALRGQDVDRIPWSPFFTYWWEARSEAIQKRGQHAYCLDIGADALLRGPTSAIRSSDVVGLAEAPLGAPYNFIDDLPGCSLVRRARTGSKSVEIDTPVGRLSNLLTYSESGNTWFVTEHMIKRKEDYKTLAYVVERMKIESCYEAVNEQIRELGEDGVYLPVISCFLKTPFQSLVENFVGTQQLAYDLYDFPDVVEETLAAMSRRALDGVRISLGSDAEVFLTWEDTSTTLMSPDTYQKYVVPDLDAWSDAVHKEGKMLVHHACGHLKALLPIMRKQRVDAIESVSPPPTGNVEIWEAQEGLAGTKALIGGIEPVHFEALSDPGFDIYLNDMLDRLSERGFILANSDSCPPGVTEKKFRRVGEIVRQRYGHPAIV